MANLRGDQGSFTFSGTTGGGSATISTTTADLDAWDGDIGERKLNTHRPFSYQLPKRTLGGLDAVGRLHFLPLEGQAQAIPGAENAATTGTLVLFVKSTSTVQSYTFKAKIWKMTIGVNSSANGVTDGWYYFAASADSASDTIVVAP